jgi:hypothetical protein
MAMKKALAAGETTIWRIGKGIQILFDSSLDEGTTGNGLKFHR